MNKNREEATDFGIRVPLSSKGTLDALQQIYLVIVGLAIAEALTKVFTKPDGSFAGTDLFKSSSWLLLTAFLVTVVRFAHGSILHFSGLSTDRTWRVSMCGLLAQALVFFVAALSLTTLTGFVIALIVILAVDSIWLLALRLVQADPPAFGQWIISNFVAGSCLGVCLGLQLGLQPPWGYQLAGAVAAVTVVAAIVDYAMNDSLYFPRSDASDIAVPTAGARGDLGSGESQPQLQVYMAGPLFTISERRQNSDLARALELRFRNVVFILPQKMHSNAPIDYAALVTDNMKAIGDADILVACLDGADADSGTSVEVGYARALGKGVLGYRTDFRQSETEGVNAMLRHGCTAYIHLSSLDEFVTLERLANDIAGKLSEQDLLNRRWQRPR